MLDMPDMDELPEANPDTLRRLAELPVAAPWPEPPQPEQQRTPYSPRLRPPGPEGGDDFPEYYLG